MNPTYYLYWGNLGDARRWMPLNRAKVNEAYARAIALIRERLQSVPGDPELLGSLSDYLAKSGDKKGTLAILMELANVSDPTPGSQFKAAVAYEVVGKRDDALRSLEAAVRSGYSIK
jgi:serine/threonine-protein kinase